MGLKEWLLRKLVGERGLKILREVSKYKTADLFEVTSPNPIDLRVLWVENFKIATSISQEIVAQVQMILNSHPINKFAINFTEMPVTAREVWICEKCRTIWLYTQLVCPDCKSNLQYETNKNTQTLIPLLGDNPVPTDRIPIIFLENQIFDYGSFKIQELGNLLIALEKKKRKTRMADLKNKERLYKLADMIQAPLSTRESIPFREHIISKGMINFDEGEFMDDGLSMIPMIDTILEQLDIIVVPYSRFGYKITQYRLAQREPRQVIKLDVERAQKASERYRKLQTGDL